MPDAIDPDAEAREPEATQGFRLSPQQERVWSLAGGGGPGPWASSCILRIDGSVDPAALRSAWRRVVERHEVLRTTVRRVPGTTLPLQVVGPAEADWRERALPEAPPAGTRVLDLDPAPREDGSPGAPVSGARATLVSGPGGASLLLLAAPVLCTDARGLAEAALEVARIAAGEGAEDDDPLQYADLAEWLREILAADEGEVDREHWRGLDLRAVPVLAAGEPFDVERVRLAPPPALPGAVRDLAGRLGVRPAAVWLAAWTALDHRLAEAGDGRVRVGVRSDGRHLEELARLPGLFARILPLVLDLGEPSSFAHLAREAERALATAESHQDCFDWRWTTAPEGVPYLRRCFEYRELPPPLAVAGATFEVVEATDVVDRFGVCLDCSGPAAGLSASLAYDAARTRADEAERLGERLLAVLEAGLAQPGRGVDDLPVVGPSELYELVVARNRTERDLAARPLDELVLEQARRTPDRIALSWDTGACGAGHLSFGALARRVLAVAAELARRGVGPEVVVGLCAERSAELVAGLLGIQAGGGAYLPLNPADPPGRLRGLLSDAGASLVLGDRTSARRFLGGVLPFLPFDEIGPAPEAVAVSGHPVERAAYVIYTSGSTGSPKGVAVPHRAIANRLLWMQRELPVDGGDTVACKTPSTFDASIWELFVPLLAGARAVLAGPDGHRDAAGLVALALRHRVTVLQLVPSFVAPFLDAGGGTTAGTLRRLYCGGEELAGPLRDRAETELGAEVHNLYGPTECAIDVTHRGGGSGRAGGSVPIGKPIANLRVFLLDPRGRPVPDGSAGELCAAGEGLARGYAGRPAATAERFVPDSFSGTVGSRLYRTGDLARYGAGGELVFAGRIDRQVKVRGVRVEPGEVEAALLDEPAVREAVVLPRSGPGGVHLVAYVVAAGEPPDVAELRRALASRLPEALVPARIVALEALPRLANGKVDRAALPDPTPGPGADGAERLRSAVEELVAEVWAALLEVDRVGPRDHFFELGGHSLLATQLVTRLRRVAGVEVSLRSVFEAPTLAAFARRVEKAATGGAGPPPIEPVARGGALPLSLNQQGLWFLQRLEPASPFYNMPVAVALRGALDPSVLRWCLARVVVRHEPLRTTFREERGRPMQEIGTVARVALPVVDLKRLDGPRAERARRRLVRDELRRPLDLSRGPLLRCTLIRTGAQEHVLLLTVHHIVSDAWSMAVLVREAGELYAARVDGVEPWLPPLPIQYADYAAWQRRWLEGARLEEEVAYWTGRLAGVPALLALATDHPRPRRQSFRGRSLPFAWPEELSADLLALRRREGVTLFMVLLAAYEVLLRHNSGQESFVVGSPFAGRTLEETEGLIGYFANLLVLRADLTGDPTFTEICARVREVTLEAHAHQHVPFDKLVEELRIERAGSHNPLVQVAFALREVPRRAVELPSLVLEPVGFDLETSQFDLTLTVGETEGRLSGVLQYGSDLFEERSAQALLESYRAILERVATDPSARLSQVLDGLAEADRERLVAAQRRSRTSLRRQLAAARRSPSAPAGEGET